MPKAVAIVVASMLVIGACGGSNEATDPAATRSPTVVIELSPTAAPTAEPTKVPEANPSGQPAAVAEPDLSDEEQAVIAAWEKYLRLVIEAQGRDPSREALDTAGYATGEALTSLDSALAAVDGSTTYLSGAITLQRPQVQFESDAVAIVQDCLFGELELRQRATDGVDSSQSEYQLGRARVVLTEEAWLLAGSETEKTCAP